MKGVAPAILLFCIASKASANDLFLTCTTTAFSGYKMSEIYKKPPKNIQEQFIIDALDLGLAGWLVNPPPTWHIDRASGAVTSPDDEMYKLKISSETVDTLEAKRVFPSGDFDRFHLNKINGKATYERSLYSADVQKSWMEKHGGKLPSLVTWSYACSAADQPKIQ